MKRSLVMLFVLALVVALAAGCEAQVESKGSGTSEATSSDEAASEAPAAEGKSEFAVGETIGIDDGEYTVVSIADFPAPDEWSKPADGKVFLLVSMRIENKGEAPLDFNPYNYKIQDANGVQSDYTWSATPPNSMSSGALAAGGKLESNLLFEVPADKAGLKLVIEPNMFVEQQVLVKLTD